MAFGLERGGLRLPPLSDPGVFTHIASFVAPPVPCDASAVTPCVSAPLRLLPAVVSVPPPPLPILCWNDSGVCFPPQAGLAVVTFGSEQPRPPSRQSADWQALQQQAPPRRLARSGPYSKGGGRGAGVRPGRLGRGGAPSRSPDARLHPAQSGSNLAVGPNCMKQGKGAGVMTLWGSPAESPCEFSATCGSL